MLIGLMSVGLTLALMLGYFVWREVRFGMNLRLHGRIRPAAGALVGLGYDLQDRLLRRRG